MYLFGCALFLLAPEILATDFALTLGGCTISTRVMSLYPSVKSLFSKIKRMQCAMYNLLVCLFLTIFSISIKSLVRGKVLILYIKPLFYAFYAFLTLLQSKYKNKVIIWYNCVPDAHLMLSHFPHKLLQMSKVCYISADIVARHTHRI